MSNRKSTVDLFDINQVIQDIFSDKNAFETKFRKYEKVRAELENESQNHIYNHYKTFIKITEELKNVQGSVEKMKTFFLEYEPLLNSLRETLRDEELAQKAKRTDMAINRQIFHFSFEDEKDDPDTDDMMEGIRNSTDNSSLNSKTVLDLTDQVSEVIDKFDIAIYEKNYTECIKIYRLFKAMKKSKKYGDIIVSYEIRKNIDFHYNRLLESLLSDIFNDTTKNVKEIVKYLIEIGQLHKAKIAVLNMKSKETERRIKAIIEENRTHDDSFFELIATEFFECALQCLKFIQEIFKEASQGNSYMSSFSTWLLSEVQSFYNTIAPYLYETDDIELSIYYLKKVSMIFMEKQSEGINLTTEFQKIAIHDLQELLDELYEAIVFNLKTSITGEEYDLYTFFPINVLEYNVELMETVSLIDITKRTNPRKSVNPRHSVETGEYSLESEEFFKNFAEDDTTKTAEMLLDISFKLTRSMNYFWNTFFFFLDLASSVKDTDNIPILSSQFFSLVQHKLESLCDNLTKSYFETVDDKALKTEYQALAFLTSLLYSRLLAENLDKLIRAKFPKLYKKNSKWKELTINFAKKYEESIGIYTKLVLLDKVAPAIVKNTAIYTKQDKKIFVDKPTLPFIALAYTLEKANDNLEFLIGPKHKQKVLYYMFYSCFICIDYTVLCIQTLKPDESQEKQPALFDKAVLDRYRIDHDSIQMLLLRNQFKLTDCTPPGMYQLIYDVNFLSILYSRLTYSEEPEVERAMLMIDTDSLLERLITLYAKEKSIKIESIKFKREIFQNAIEEIFAKGVYEELKNSLPQ